MRKKERQRLIARLLREETVRKQEDFVALLGAQGVIVTQATISRDIKEMKLIKVPAIDGGYRYSLPAQTTENTSLKLAKMLKDAFVSIDQFERQIILRTIPGSGPAVASLIEKHYQELVFAAISDDHNVLIICRMEKEAEFLKNEIFNYL